MKRNLRKTISMILAMIMCCAVPVQAIAAETSTGTVDVETTAGNEEPVDVTITIEKTDNGDGTTTTNTTTEAAGDVTESGMIVDYNGSSSTVTDDESGDIVSGTENTDYSAVNGSGTYGADGGSNKVTGAEAPNVTVEIPTVKDKSDTKDTGSEVGKEVVAPGSNPPSGPNDGTYDYTTETVVKKGSATVETTDVKVSASEISSEYKDKEGLELIINKVDPTADNDLSASASNVEIDEALEKAKEIGVKEGYQFVYVGDNDSSQFWAAYLYTTPQVEGEKPFWIDTDENGNVIQEYYIGRVGKNGALYKAPKCYYIEGMYMNGEKYNDVETGARWDSVQNYVLVDPVTGKITTAYCADQKTPTVEGFSYNMENVEDGIYYSQEDAAKIRAVAKNGYWGTEDGMGSLSAVKEMMRNAKDENGAPVFTDNEIDSLTDGVAMSATQFAIWSYSNAFDNAVFLNAQYIPKDNDNEYNLGLLGKSKGDGTIYDWDDYLTDVPEGKEPSVALLFKLYNHLIGLPAEPAAETIQDSAHVVYTPDNFIKDLDIKVIDKVADHKNNQDDDKDNDAYITDLSFALVVAPSTENGDDIIVRVLDKDGKSIAEARIAGTPKEGETYQQLKDDGNGNFVFQGIELIEGEQEFNITLEGIQNLEWGVYLYTSEVRIENDEETSSQTLVGMAGGEHAVNVSMTVSFELDVEDEIVTRERVWRTEWKEPESDNPPPPNNPPREQVPPPPSYTTTVRKTNTSIIPDEDVPLADSVETGDASFVFAGIAIAAALGLAVVNLLGRKAKEN